MDSSPDEQPTSSPWITTKAAARICLLSWLGLAVGVLLLIGWADAHPFTLGSGWLALHALWTHPLGVALSAGALAAACAPALRGLRRGPWLTRAYLSAAVEAGLLLFLLRVDYALGHLYQPPCSCPPDGVAPQVFQGVIWVITVTLSGEGAVYLYVGLQALAFALAVQLALSALGATIGLSRGARGVTPRLEATRQISVIAPWAAAAGVFVWQLDPTLPSAAVRLLWVEPRAAAAGSAALVAALLALWIDGRSARARARSAAPD